MEVRTTLTPLVIFASFLAIKDRLLLELDVLFTKVGFGRLFWTVFEGRDKEVVFFPLSEAALSLLNFLSSFFPVRTTVLPVRSPNMPSVLLSPVFSVGTADKSKTLEVWRVLDRQALKNSRAPSLPNCSKMSLSNFSASKSATSFSKVSRLSNKKLIRDVIRSLKRVCEVEISSSTDTLSLPIMLFMLTWDVLSTFICEIEDLARQKSNS